MLNPLNDMAKSVHQTALERGWWNNPYPTFGDIIALIHSEGSEALTEFRNGHGYTKTYWKHGDEERSVARDEEGNQGSPEGIPIEFADIIIRVLDACAAYGIDIDAAMAIKMEYNLTRPLRHGGKRI